MIYNSTIQCKRAIFLWVEDIVYQNMIVFVMFETEGLRLQLSAGRTFYSYRFDSYMMELSPKLLQLLNALLDTPTKRKLCLRLIRECCSQ